MRSREEIQAEHRKALSTLAVSQEAIAILRLEMEVLLNIRGGVYGAGK